MNTWDHSNVGSKLLCNFLLLSDSHWVNDWLVFLVLNVLNYTR